MQRCVYIETVDKKILVFDRLSCKSKFENALMPLDKSIQVHSRTNATNHMADAITVLLHIIVDSLINGNGFWGEERKIIEKKHELLNDKTFCDLMTKIFYKYTTKLLGYIQTGQYEKAYNDYIKNKDY